MAGMRRWCPRGRVERRAGHVAVQPVQQVRVHRLAAPFTTSSPSEVALAMSPIARYVAPPDHHLPGPGNLLQPRGDVHRVAGGVEVAQHLTADIAHQRLADVDAYFVHQTNL